MSADLLIPNGQLIIFNFPAGAGGKMLQNCVGLSRHCVLNKLSHAQWQMNYTQPIGPEFYQQKLNWILETLPPQDKLKYWLGYEFGELDIYGINFMGFQKHLPVPNAKIYQLPDKNLWSTLTVHNFGSTEHYVLYWPTIKYVTLVNNEQFGRRCLSWKNPDLKFDSDWATAGRTPPGIGFDFDIDATIYDRDKFLNQVRELYDYLGFDDFPQEYIQEYYARYMELHV